MFVYMTVYIILIYDYLSKDINNNNSSTSGSRVTVEVGAAAVCSGTAAGRHEKNLVIITHTYDLEEEFKDVVYDAKNHHTYITTHLKNIYRYIFIKTNTKTKNTHREQNF